MLNPRLDNGVEGVKERSRSGEPPVTPLSNALFSFLVGGYSCMCYDHTTGFLIGRMYMYVYSSFTVDDQLIFIRGVITPCYCQMKIVLPLLRSPAEPMYKVPYNLLHRTVILKIVRVALAWRHYWMS